MESIAKRCGPGYLWKSRSCSVFGRDDLGCIGRGFFNCGASYAYPPLPQIWIFVKHVCTLSSMVDVNFWLWYSRTEVFPNWRGENPNFFLFVSMTIFMSGKNNTWKSWQWLHTEQGAEVKNITLSKCENSVVVQYVCFCNRKIMYPV